MKPDWKDAPAWAQFLAMDPDGRWFWFDSKPIWYDRAWMAITCTKCTEAKQPANAKYSLEERPNE